jgi:hypothetical protein
MAVVNQFTKSKKWQRLRYLDEAIEKKKKECKQLYIERVQLVEEMYGNGNADNGARSGASKRGICDR